MTDDLSLAVSALTDPQTRKLIDCTCPTHGGKRSHVFVDEPLLVQLEAAIRSSIGGSMSGSSLASTRNLLDPAALYQSMLITDAIGSWCRLAGLKPTRDATVDLLAWHASSPTAGDFYVGQLDGWAAFIRAKMDPTKALEVSGACPTCGAAVWVDLEGIEHPRPVLLTYHPEDPLTTVTAMCRVVECSAEWQGEMAVRLLRAQIDSDPAPLLAFLRNSA